MKRFCSYLLIVSVFFVFGFTGCQTIKIEQDKTIVKWMKIMPIGTPVMNDNRKFKITHGDIALILEHTPRISKKIQAHIFRLLLPGSFSGLYQ